MKLAAFVTALLCVPAFAASTIEINCEEEAARIQDVTVAELAVDASHDQELKPQVEALIREAFAEDAPPEVEETAENAEEISVREAVNRAPSAKLPGVSGEDAEFYRRKMYRTDI